MLEILLEHFVIMVSVVNVLEMTNVQEAHNIVIQIQESVLHAEKIVTVQVALLAHSVITSSAVDVFVTTNVLSLLPLHFAMK